MTTLSEHINESRTGYERNQRNYLETLALWQPIQNAYWLHGLNFPSSYEKYVRGLSQLAKKFRRLHPKETSTGLMESRPFYDTSATQAIGIPSCRDRSLEMVRQSESKTA